MGDRKEFFPTNLPREFDLDSLHVPLHRINFLLELIEPFIVVGQPLFPALE